MSEHDDTDQFIVLLDVGGDGWLVRDTDTGRQHGPYTTIDRAAQAAERFNEAAA